MFNLLEQNNEKQKKHKNKNKNKNENKEKCKKRRALEGDCADLCKMKEDEKKKIERTHG